MDYEQLFKKTLTKNSCQEIYKVQSNLNRQVKPLSTSKQVEIVSSKRKFDKIGGAALTRSQSKRFKNGSKAEKFEPDFDKIDELEPDFDEPGQLEANFDKDDQLQPDFDKADQLQQRLDEPTQEPEKNDTVESSTQEAEIPKDSANFQPLVTSNGDYEKDTIVVDNDLVSAHIYRSVHRHQKIFQ